MAVSNNITAILNFVALLSSIPIVGAGIWLASRPDNECIRLFRWPVVLLGLLILIVALAGFVGAYWNRQCLLAFHLFCIAVLIFILLILLIFAFVVTRPDGGYAVPGLGYKEYRLRGFSPWLRNYITNSGIWVQIRTCLAESDVCIKLSQRQDYITADQFFSAHISPLQSGCCKPPTICGYQLCYGCSACQAGLLGNLRKEWRKANVNLITALVALISVYIIACCAFKNSQTEDLFRHYKQGWT